MSPDDQTKAILKRQLRYEYELYYFIKQRLYSHLCLMQKTQPRQQTMKFNYTNYFGHKKKFGSPVGHKGIGHKKDNTNDASQLVEKADDPDQKINHSHQNSQGAEHRNGTNPDRKLVESDNVNDDKTQYGDQEDRANHSTEPNDNNKGDLVNNNSQKINQDGDNAH